MKKYNILLISFVVILVCVFGWLSANMYLPALPSLDKIFHTRHSLVRLSFSLFLLSYAFSQLVWGPVSEVYGRRKLLILGMCISFLGLLLIVFTNNIYIFNLGRFVEGIGVGAGPVLGRSVLADLCELEEITKVLSLATICINLMPAVAPIFGGEVFHYLGWRAIFIILTAISVILGVLVFAFIPESLKELKDKLDIKEIFNSFRSVTKNKTFIQYSKPYILIAAGLVGYYSLLPFVFITELHVSAKIYGYYNLVSVASYILGAIIVRVYTRADLDKLLRFSLISILATTILFSAYTFYYPLTIFSILAFMSLYTFWAGIICPLGNSLAINSVRTEIGTGSALLGFGYYLASSIFSWIVSLLPLEHYWIISLFFLAIALGANWHRSKNKAI